MTCTQANLTATTVTAPTPSNITGATKAGTNRRLFVCDNPEALTSTIGFGTNNMATLWHDTVSGRTRVSYRIFIWHANQIGSTARIAVTVGNASLTDTLRIENLRWELAAETPITQDFLSGTGLCLAKAQLGRTLNATTPVDSVINTNSVGVVKEFGINQGNVKGAVLEFDIVSSSGSAMQYKVRTVVARTSTADFRTQQAAPVSLVKTHPRGSWDFSDIIGNTITYDLGSGKKSTNISNGSTDNLFKADSSCYDYTNALPNTGHYGANYAVTVNLSNNTGSTKTAVLYLNARAGNYVGAVKVNGGTTYGVPKITPSTGGAVEIHRVSVPNGTTIPVQLEFAHAGGSALAVAVMCDTL
ncbi:hypothetical protein [Cohnella laeviribosi]|uniref:hypothetical protein n=1 Tax=Cohnella laeviribosi TaxID=380174 RepID=UPI00039FD75D|nr:hypothetical protein [Cohnella laeviribosi]